MIVFGLILAAGMFYVAKHLSSDLSVEKATNMRPFIMLAGALLIAWPSNSLMDSTTPPTRSQPSYIRTRWSLMSRWLGRGFATSPGCSFHRCGGFRHRIATAGRVDFAGGQRWWFLN